MDVPVIATEQYPKGLGSTVEPLKSMLPTPVPEKLMFSCRECDGEFGELQSRGVHNLLVTGIESHVCVLQSTLDFLSMGFDVFVVVDAIGSRFEIDHETALCRLELSGATLVTTEMSLFELCERAGSDQFKAISKIVQEEMPGESD